MNIIFFGSTSDSVLVLEKLTHVIAVVTQPPRPVGRKHIVTPTPVETWAKEKHIPVLYVPSELESFKADLLVSASYGEKIPTKTITDAKYGGLNVHPSLLPRWRGADPVPWAILSGDHQIGVTVITLSEDFDEGKIIAQKKLSITAKDTSDPLRTKLFEIGAQLLVEILKSIGDALQGEVLQGVAPTPYARRFTREDGFEPWEKIIDPNEAIRIERKFRAFHPWPGLWTIKDRKRLKILACHLESDLLVLDQIQWEGKKPLDMSKN